MRTHQRRRGVSWSRSASAMWETEVGMDGTRFDAVTRSAAGPRRRVVAGVPALALGGIARGLGSPSQVRARSRLKRA